MRLVLLAARNSIHTVRWANEMSRRGHEVHLLSLHSGGDALDPRVRLHTLPIPPPTGYFLNAPGVRRLLGRLEPDIVHAHYASGYGTLGRLSKFHPFVLSVWGSDVYEFPRRSALHRHTLLSNLSSADWVCSTSNTMAEQVQRLCRTVSRLSVVPFGVSVDMFRPRSDLRDSRHITVGTVKALAVKYGIDVLVRAFASARTTLAGRKPELAERLRLLIVGDGRDRRSLERLAESLGIGEVTQFTGHVEHAQVPGYLNRLDIFVALSRHDSESFGVAVVEASSCELPVIVSDAGGLPEVVVDRVTGLVVRAEDVEGASRAVAMLAEDPGLRGRLGAAGRQRVLQRYNWADNASLMESIYLGLAARDPLPKQSGTG